MPGFHEVDIAAQCVDLPIVRDVAHRVSTLPAWERVRRKPDSKVIRFGFD